MQRLLLFTGIAVLATFAGCTQSAMEPISQQPVVNIDDYFWKIGQNSATYIDSTESVGYTLTFSSPHDTLIVKDGTAADSFQCIINQDSIYAFGYGLARNSVFDTDDAVFDGGLVLLRSNPFGNDSSWIAGTLRSRTTHNYIFTAHALAHFDTLQIATTNNKDTVINKYPDVLVVRYSYDSKTPVYSQDTVPYWIIYYAKNIGPVMVDKVIVTGAGASQKMVSERREIKQ